MHGIEEQEQGNTDNIVLNVIKEHLDIELSVKDFGRSHKIGKSNSKSKRRPIIVKFISYNDRRAIFSNKKQLKGTGISITESLTAEKMRQLKSARDQFGFNNVWSIDERIMYKDSTTTKPKLFYGIMVKRIDYGKRKRFVFRTIAGIVEGKAIASIAKGKELA